MKMKKLLLIVAVGLVLFSGCKKETKETCSDGIKNQNETGVDCGGSCMVCPTCSDGIMNGAETGVDCGGSCSACLPPQIFGTWHVYKYLLYSIDKTAQFQNQHPN